ncbi:MAG: WxcM-like domain-containing protein [Microgenomates group bacterium]
MIDTVQIEDAKKVATFDLEGKENGFLVELFREDRFTLSYLTCAKPGAFKGYHLHKVRAARYMCVKGTMKIILYVDGKREEHVLSSDNLKRLYIPKNVPTGLENIGAEDAWLINLPEPAYDPDLKDEQVDFTQEELDSGDYLTKL